MKSIMTKTPAKSPKELKGMIVLNEQAKNATDEVKDVISIALKLSRNVRESLSIGLS